MRILRPVEATQMRDAIINGIGVAVGFLLIYALMEKFDKNLADKMK